MQTFDVNIEHNGKKYRGYASVEKGSLTVEEITMGSKSASESGDNEFLAKLLLKEIIDDYERDHK